MSPESEPPPLEALRARLDEEEAAYSEVLMLLDRLAGFELPAEAAPEARERLERLNVLWSAAERPTGGGVGGALRARVFDAVAPALERQAEFNAALVQLLNAHLGPLERLHAHLRELAGTLVRYAQRVQPLVDARGRVASALATTRSELVLEAFDRRLESLGRRSEGLAALRDRLAAMAEEIRMLRSSLAVPVAGDGSGATEATSATSRQRLKERVERLRDTTPVMELGCGPGDLLQCLRTAGVAARGVDPDAGAVRQCREKDLDVTEGDPVDVLKEQPDESLGGVFAAGLAERLAPGSLTALLAESHRTLRPGGLLLLEAGPSLHPDTLRFLATAAGFTDVRIEPRSEVPAGRRLQPVPPEGLPERAAGVLNDNIERLNALVFGPLDYALLARR